MANFADLLTPKSRKIFDSIVEDEKQKVEQEILKRQERIRSFYDRNGFKSFDELFEYLISTGKRVYTECGGTIDDYGIYLQWDKESEQIRHQVYENTDIDMTIGYSDLYYTKEQFLKKFDKYEGLNQFGYIHTWVRDVTHSVKKYKDDDRFHFHL